MKPIIYKYIPVLFILAILSGCGGVISTVKSEYYNSIGDYQYQKKNYSKAFDNYKASAQEGGDYGYYRLYVMYMKGQGVDKNQQIASDMLNEAARLGNSMAEVILANRLIFTIKNRDVTRGLKLLKSAASKENKYAYAELYSVYWNGIGVKRDIVKAGEYYRLAKAQGLDLQKNKVLHSNNGNSMKQLVFKIQKGLKELGFYQGSIDGISGPMTRKSIVTFQRFYGYSIDSKVSQRVLDQIEKETKR